MSEKHVLYVVDAHAQCEAVQISPALWAVVEKHVLASASRLTGGDDPFARPEPLAALEELKAYWDFPFPYEPHVHCDACHVKTDNWEADPAHPFHLVNANLGGLLVFRCRSCRSTIRKKHFRDHIVFECSAQHPRS